MKHSNEHSVIREAGEAGEAISTDCIACGKPYIIDPNDDRDPNSGECEACEEKSELFQHRISNNPESLFHDVQLALEKITGGDDEKVKKIMGDKYYEET